MARLPCTKVREWVDCAQGGQWPMYSQKGGSLDVVCSSERKKSGSTLRHHQHPGRGKAVGGHRAPSLCPSEAAKPREVSEALLHLSLEIGRVSQSELRSLTNGTGNWELRSLTNGTVKSHKRNRELGTAKSHKRNRELPSLTIGTAKSHKRNWRTAKSHNFRL